MKVLLFYIFVFYHKFDLFLVELDVDHLLKQKGEQTYDDEELDGELDFDLLARANFGGGEFEKDREIIEEELERKVGNRR